MIVLGLSGCYTIIWSPNSEFPTQENSDNSAVYYDDYYYGPYYGWYDVPWWYDYVPPASGTPYTRDNTSETSRIRDTDGGRGGSGEVPRVDPPSRNEDNSGNSSGTNKDNSGNSNSGSSSRNSDSGNNNSNRNNDGGRNSGGRK